MISSATPDPDTTLELRRTFPAGRERLFKAWTDAEQLKRWFAPGAYRVAFAEVDLRVGGAYRIGMQGEEGEPSVAVGTYREIVPPERIVFTWRWENGEMDETLVTVEFNDLGGATEVVLLHEMFPTADVRDLHKQGWNGCLDHLAQYL